MCSNEKPISFGFETPVVFCYRDLSVIQMRFQRRVLFPPQVMLLSQGIKHKDMLILSSTLLNSPSLSRLLLTNSLFIHTSIFPQPSTRIPILFHLVFAFVSYPPLLFSLFSFSLPSPPFPFFPLLNSPSIFFPAAANDSAQRITDLNPPFLF